MLIPDTQNKKTQFPRNLKQLTAFSVLLPLALLAVIILFWCVQITNPKILSSISIYYSIFLYVLCYLFVWGSIPITIQHYKRLVRDSDMRPDKRRLTLLIRLQCLILIPTTYFFVTYIFIYIK